VKTIEKRKEDFPDRPLIRISSTFFWHLSSDYELAPIGSLAQRIEDKEKTVYEPMKVGQQVQKYVF